MKFKYRRYFLYYAGLPLLYLLSMLPMRITVALGGLIGRVAFELLPRYRRITLENLSSVFKNEKEEDEIRLIARKVFENLGKNVAEVINFPKINKDNINKIVTFENREILEKALEAGRGVVVLTGHFGNWEILSSALWLNGYRGAAIARRLYFGKYDKLVNRLRVHHGANFINRDESPKKMLRILKNNAIIGMLADQDVDSIKGVFVDFFGRSAYTPTAPVQLARTTGAKLIPTFVLRRKRDHLIIMKEPLELEESEDKERDLVVNTQKWTRVFESFIRKYPDQWVWMHRRWKTQPC